MTEKLSEINKQLETLTALINEYQESFLQERVIITKDDFHKIDHLGNIYEKRFFNYRNGMVFILYGNSDTYSGNIYKKLMSGELEQLILNRKNITLRCPKNLLRQLSGKL